MTYSDEGATLSMTEVRCVIIVLVALGLVVTGVFPWMDTWPVEDVATYIKADPYNTFTDFLPQVKMVPFWERALYEVTVPFWPAIWGQLGSILGIGAWLWALTRNAELRARLRAGRPPYCGIVEGQDLAGAVSISSSGTVGP